MLKLGYRGQDIFQNIIGEAGCAEFPGPRADRFSADPDWGFPVMPDETGSYIRIHKTELFQIGIQPVSEFR